MDSFRVFACCRFQGVPVRVPFSKPTVFKSCLQIVPFSCAEEACPSHSFCTVFNFAGIV